MKQPAGILLAVLFCSPLLADWRVSIDKKPNEITGLRNAYAQVGAKGLAAGELVIGCTDGKPVLRITERFRSFRVTGFDGNYYSRVKLRPSMAPEFIEVDALLAQNAGIKFLVVDNRLVELLPKMKMDQFLLVQISYEGQDAVVKFPMAGLDVALAKLEAVGCRP